MNRQKVQRIIEIIEYMVKFGQEFSYEKEEVEEHLYSVLSDYGLTEDLSSEEESAVISELLRLVEDNEADEIARIVLMNELGY